MTRAGAAALLLLLVAPTPSRASLTASVWPNSAFAPAAAATVSITPDVSLESLSLAVYATVRFTGTVTPPADDALNFTILSEGVVRLWVDDHVLITGSSFSPAPSGVGRAAFQLLPVRGGVPLPFRLEFSRAPSAAAPALALSWAGAATPAARVPAAAFGAADAAPGAAERAALRDRLAAPAQPWQTYHRASAAAHVFAPTGFFVDLSLVDAVTGAALSSPFVVNREGDYLARAGLHAEDGSTYTAFSVWAWRGLACNVTVETTVAAADAQLLLLAAAAGADCARLRLVVVPGAQEERAAFPATTEDGGFAAELPGFPAVAVTPSGAPLVALNGSAPPVYFAFALNDGVDVGYCAAPVVGRAAAAPACPPVAAARAAIDAARARTAASFVARFGAPLADVAAGIASSLSWNTIFNPHEGVIAIVSRSPQWAQFGTDVDEYVLFCWDSYFIALQAAVIGEPAGALRDIALSTLIQVTLGRTTAGFVPNWKSGGRATFDRSENQVGALVARLVLARAAAADAAWLARLLFPALLSWHEWVWASRVAAGGALGAVPLFTQGSDPWAPPGNAAPRDHGEGTMQGARYESMDNSPLYDAPPVGFNATTHRMQLYDVSPTALLLADVDALAALAPAAGRADAVPLLRGRFNATSAALNELLWDEQSGAYVNRLFNGSFYRRFAPPAFFPLLGGAAPDARAAALGAALASPSGFCVNATHAPGGAARGATAPLARWGGRAGAPPSAACVTTACTRALLDARRLGFVALEASVVAAGGAAALPGAQLVPLFSYASAAQGGRTALATAPPDATFAVQRQEGFCLGAPLPPAASPAFRAWPLTNLTLWRAGAAGDVRTCGTAACEAEAAAAGYAPAAAGGAMCLAWDAAGPETWPCVVPVPSLARIDMAFGDQDYWRGRAWAPHAFLVYLGLARYAHVPALAAARADLAALGASVFESEWRDYGRVGENYNAWTGITQDSGDADPWYAWGGLWGLPSILEAGF